MRNQGAPRFPKSEIKREQIHAYLENEVSIRNVARLAMHRAEEDWRASSKQVMLSTDNIDMYLQDLSELDTPPQGYESD